MLTTATAQKSISNTKVALTAAVVALLITACGSSTSSSDESSTTTPAGEAGEAPPAETSAAETGDTVEPAESSADAETSVDEPSGEGDAPATTYEIDEALAAQQFIPASSFDLPCETYVEASEYPLFPCDKGQLVEDLQRALTRYDGDIEVDGFFGADTVGVVQELQRSFGLYDTGIADGVLLSLIAGVDAVPDEPTDGEPIVDAGLTATEIADLCTAIIESDVPDIGDFEYELCERNGYLPVSAE